MITLVHVSLMAGRQYAVSVVSEDGTASNAESIPTLEEAMARAAYFVKLQQSADEPVVKEWFDKQRRVPRTGS